MFITENIPAIVSVTFILAGTYKIADHFVVANFICVVADKWRLWWFRVKRAYGSSCAQCSAVTGYALLCAVWPSAEELNCQNETAGLARIHATSAVRTEGTVVLEGCLRRACRRHKQQTAVLLTVRSLSTFSSMKNRDPPSTKRLQDVHLPLRWAPCLLRQLEVRAVCRK
jgi:hypothetical protein